MNSTFDDRVLGNLDSRCGPSLTTVRRCGTVAGKEPRNSIASSGYRIRQSRGFFVPVRFHGGRVTDKKPRKGEEVRLSGCRFRASRLLRVRRLETSPRGHLDQPGDVLMAQSIIPFNFHSHAVRIVMRDGNPWF
ncbi:hypothetical protein, partial [Xylella fastidiosa]|uniref:hypothetical protein n=1 Tax=Xylella fastidiosa TaxID=2371 RepID=UPI00234EEE0D